MGLVFDFLSLTLYCFDALAWPSFALAYPLYASIRAVETNSKHRMRKLITYWIIFSLICLFELGLAQLIEWVPFWHRIKLISIILLVIPHFNGAFHVYQTFIHPCLYMDLQVGIRELSKPNVRIYVNKDALPVDTGTHLEENEFIEEMRLGSKEVEQAEADLSQAQINTCALAGGEKPETPPVTEYKITAISESVQVHQECTCDSTTSKELLNDHLVGKKCEELKAVKEREKNVKSSLSTMNQLHQDNQDSENEDGHAEGELAQRVETFVSMEVKETVTKPVTAESKPTETAASTKVQKEWTCAMCQVITSSEKTLNEHLKGKRHWEKCEEQKAFKQKAKNIDASSTTDKFQANQGPDSVAKSGMRASAATEVKVPSAPMSNLEGKFSGIPNSTNVQKEWNCDICQVTTSSQSTLDSHLRGNKHRSVCQLINASSSSLQDGSNQTENRKFTETTRVNMSNQQQGKGRKVDYSSSGVKQSNSKLLCSICNIRCPDKRSMEAHIIGKKHIANLQKMISLQQQPMDIGGCLDDLFGQTSYVPHESFDQSFWDPLHF